MNNFPLRKRKKKRTCAKDKSYSLFARSTTAAFLSSLFVLGQGGGRGGGGRGANLAPLVASTCSALKQNNRDPSREQMEEEEEEEEVMAPGFRREG